MAVQFGVDVRQRPLAGVQGEAVAHAAEPTGEAEVRPAGGEHRNDRRVREELPDRLRDRRVQRGIHRTDLGRLADEPLELDLVSQITQRATQLGVHVLVGLPRQRTDVQLQIRRAGQYIDRLAGRQHRG